MGHAGAVISGGGDTAEAKMAVMRDAGILVCESPSELGAAMKDLLAGRKAKAAAPAAAPAKAAVPKSPAKAPAKVPAKTAPRAAAKPAAKVPPAKKKPSRR
jgi:hypothetical protein